MSCEKLLCKKDVFDRSSHRKLLLAMKKEKGHNFEQDDEYKSFTNCMSEVETYLTKKECKKTASPKQKKKKESPLNNELTEIQFAKIFKPLLKKYSAFAKITLACIKKDPTVAIFKKKEKDHKTFQKEIIKLQKEHEKNNKNIDKEIEEKYDKHYLGCHDLNNEEKLRILKEMNALSQKYPEWSDKYERQRGGISRKRKVNGRKNRTYKH